VQGAIKSWGYIRPSTASTKRDLLLPLSDTLTALVRELR
jgi:hypothetical protein